MINALSSGWPFNKRTQKRTHTHHHHHQALNQWNTLELAHLA